MGIVQKGIGQSLISVQEFLLGSRTCTIAPAILFNTFLVSWFMDRTIFVHLLGI